MSKEITIFREWMRRASPEQKKQLARDIGTSYMTLFQYATGMRQVSPSRARDIELATARYRAEGSDLPVLYRTDLARACAACEFAQSCLGSKAVRSEFNVEESS